MFKRSVFGLLAALALPNYNLNNCKFLSIFLHVFVCVSVDYNTGQGFWLNLPMPNSVNVFGLHHLHWKCWHHCFLCTALLTMWMMPVSSFVAYFLH